MREPIPIRPMPADATSPDARPESSSEPSSDARPPAALSADEARSLRRLVALMIPASAAHDVPGADDDAIFADIVASLGRDAPAVQLALRQLDRLGGGCFADLPPEARQAVARRWREDGAAPLSAVVAATVRCYYRDDRVMRAIGLEPRPPYPQGFTVEEGDWSLLEPVRRRRRIWRDAP